LKIILSILLFASLLFANNHNNSLKIQILENICSGIKNIKAMPIYSDDIEIQKAFKNVHRFNVVENFNDAKLIILSKNVDKIKKFPKKHIFVLNYDLLETIPNSFGAFFWKKGRPNIVFIKPRLKEQLLKLSSELEPYIEEKIW